MFDLEAFMNGVHAFDGMGREYKFSSWHDNDIEYPVLALGVETDREAWFTDSGKFQKSATGSLFDLVRMDATMEVIDRHQPGKKIDAVKARHELKILPPYFEAVIDGRKTFEIRKDDRGFQAGDTVTLREYDPSYKGYYRGEDEMYSGRKYDATIGYVTAYEQKDGYVVFSLISNGEK